MNRENAVRLYEEFCTRARKPVRTIDPTPLRDGSWLFAEAEEFHPDKRVAQYDAVAVRANGEAFRVEGAIGKVFRSYTDELRAPRSSERFLGSADARYQSFDGGVAVWERKENLGFPVLESMNPLRKQTCAVAFFDLRGFTTWSRDAPSDDVQQAVQVFEDSVHDGFPVEPTPWKQLFLKGTGDGVMIVSQADWYHKAPYDKHMSALHAGHAGEFLAACERTIEACRARFTHYGLPLATGCGIAVGELHRLFLFGRFDFIGPAANEAAKLQQHAWNEVCVTKEFGAALSADGRRLDVEWELASKGWRLVRR